MFRFVAKKNLIRLPIFNRCNVQYQRFSADFRGIVENDYTEQELGHETELHFIQSRKKAQHMPLKCCEATLQNLLQLVITQELQKTTFVKIQ